MNSGFLRTYSIPTLPQNEADAEKINEVVQSADSPLKQSAVGAVGISNYSRYIAPGSHGNPIEVKVSQKPMKRKYPNKEFLEQNGDSKIAMFTGRDASYPDALNSLINPLSCELCKIKINSLKSAKDHYESKSHDRKITAWLAENCGDNPPVVKRFVKEGPTGPDAYHCEICDLPLTSLLHANQHYAGRKHKLVANNISKPSGPGYYNAEGKWVRQKNANVNIPGRFGIGMDFVQPEANGLTQTTNSQSQNPKSQDSATPYNLLYCLVCKISVTSTGQMETHLSGAKHRKNLTRASADPAMLSQAGMPDKNAANFYKERGNGIRKDSILAATNDEANANNDLSMYRTPTGLYYCQICNISLQQITALEQHIQGKKHTKKVAEMNANEKKST